MFPHLKKSWPELGKFWEGNIYVFIIKSVDLSFRGILRNPFGIFRNKQECCWLKAYLNKKWINEHNRTNIRWL